MYGLLRIYQGLPGGSCKAWSRQYWLYLMNHGWVRCRHAEVSGLYSSVVGLISPVVWRKVQYFSFLRLPLLPRPSPVCYDRLDSLIALRYCWELLSNMSVCRLTQGSCSLLLIFFHKFKAKWLLALLRNKYKTCRPSFNRIFRPCHTKLCLWTAEGEYILVHKLQFTLSCTTGKKSLLLINIDLLSRETQHSNTVHSFSYFFTTCFSRSIRRPLSVWNTTTHSEMFVMAESSLSLFLFLWRCGPTRGRASSFFRFLDQRRRATVGRTPLDEWSVRRSYLYLTTHNTYSRQTSILLARFKPAVSAGERPQTYALDRAATRTGLLHI
jgi:hypothetical protein